MRRNNLIDGFAFPFSNLLISARLMPVISASCCWVSFLEIRASKTVRRPKIFDLLKKFY